MPIRCALAVLPLLASMACASKDVDPGTGSGGSSSGTGGGSGSGAVLGGSGGAGAAGRGGASTGGEKPGAGAGGSGGTTGGTAGDKSSAGGAGMPLGGVGSAGLGGTAAGGAAAGGAGLSGAGGRAAGGAGGSAGANAGPVSITVFEDAVFFDGYATVSNDPVPAGVVRLRNDLLTRKLTDAELDSIQNTLKVEVVIGALCDNYDRIGSVALAFVPKGQSKYAPDDVERIEVGRYITPFMDKNKKPDEVPYDFDADNLAPVLRDPELRAEFDLWLELELFGVPYAANDEVSGCANRSDVFRGSVTLASDSSAAAAAFNDLLPLTYKASFNNYERGATDMIGATKKTLEFTLAADTADTQLVLITSNHGANSGGEEYSRRDHFVSVDGEQVLKYKPGRTSCEPFRMFNTQANGIYGSSKRSDSDWQSFSNWCPGDVIDTRVIPLGALPAGKHSFVIEVPDAEFVGGEGNLPVSLYVQSLTN
ncbi:MAG TPA: peptide-N-glycosidase F-related protein [Polyangiaceae bacterium]|nr:peptide-N-glycosidase F-related protein [Polyangiaceae bacterium]